MRINHSITISTLNKMKKNQNPISCLTCYDASHSFWFDQADIDVLLVGDSLGQVVQGHDTTVPVTLAQMVYHTQCVSRQASRCFIMADVPFLEQATFERALQAAQALMQAGANMIKMEGGTWLASTVAKLAERDIPVCAHIGYTPQSIHALGGPKMAGKTTQQATSLIEQAQQLEQAGAQLMIVECVPDHLAATLANTLTCPVIGIGSGPDCDGQILVSYDMLGITPPPLPPFARCFLDQNNPSILQACQHFKQQVVDRTFPVKRKMNQPHKNPC